MDVAPERRVVLMNAIEPVSRIQAVMKDQVLEVEGPSDQGRVWFSTRPLIHAFIYNPAKDTNKGTQIWKKAEPVLFSQSLHNQAYRTNRVQAVEQGVVLSISYPNVRLLIEQFPEVKAYVEKVSHANEQYHAERSMMLAGTLVDHVIAFEKQNKLFCVVASNAMQATHLAITRQSYHRVKKIIEARRDEQDEHDDER